MDLSTYGDDHKKPELAFFFFFFFETGSHCIVLAGLELAV
jgi:hypothetical protein